MMPIVRIEHRDGKWKALSYSGLHWLDEHAMRNAMQAIVNAKGPRSRLLDEIHRHYGRCRLAIAEQRSLTARQPVTVGDAWEVELDS